MKGFYRMRTANLPKKPNSYTPVPAGKKPKNLHQPGYVYLMHYPSTGAPYFKIGASKNPWRRYMQLRQDWNLYNVMLVAVSPVPNMAEAEEFLHQKFAPWHASGNEYFMLPDDALVLAIYEIGGIAHEYKQNEYAKRS